MGKRSRSPAKRAGGGDGSPIAHLLIGDGECWRGPLPGRRGLRRSVATPELPRADLRHWVAPKYADPADPAKTWSGRGRQARWLREKLAAGARLEDFRVRD